MKWLQLDCNPYRLKVRVYNDLVSGMFYFAYFVVSLCLPRFMVIYLQTLKGIRVGHYKIVLRIKQYINLEQYICKYINGRT